LGLAFQQVSLTGRDAIDSVLYGTRLTHSEGDPAGPFTLTYAFLQELPSYETRQQFSGELSDNLKAQVTNAAQVIETFVNVQFVETDNPDLADIRIGMTNSLGEIRGSSFSPHAAGDQCYWLNDSFYTEAAEIAPGTQLYRTLQHEFLHTLGLKHPFDTSKSNGTIDPNAFFLQTTMAYGEYPGDEADHIRSGTNQPSTPMYRDVLALQHLYGASQVAAGDTTWALDGTPQALFDTSGRDTVDGSGLQTALALNLGNWGSGATRQLANEPYQWTEDGAGSIGEGVILLSRFENVAGSNLADSVRGNAVANTLEGGAGADRLWGDAAVDALHGGPDGDTLWGGSGNDVLRGSGTENPDGDGADSLLGEAGNDFLDGGAGNDRLFGAAGTDQLRGGPNSDRFMFGKPGDSGLGASADIIPDFSRSERDKIDLAALDAQSGSAGSNEAFTFRGTSPFTGAGQVRYFQSGGATIVQISNDADASAELDIRLAGQISLQAGDFLL
jgi:serralysin